MLEVRNLDQFYGESHTLWDVSLDVPQGQSTCLMGRNGVGKTTLLKSLMGLLPIKGGSIRFAGNELQTKGPEVRARLGIGYVPQGREIFPQLTVRENLDVGFLLGAQNRNEVEGKIFDLFPALKSMLHRRGGDLSGGQQQQLAIARALALQPKLLILDEPTEGIQPNVVHQIGDVLLRLLEEGLTILLVEQKLPFASRVAQRFTIVDRGRTVAAGTMGELDNRLVAQYLVV